MSESQRLGELRTDLSTYRSALLSMMRSANIERLPVDNNRVAVVKDIVSTKAITRARVLEVIQTTVKTLQQCKKITDTLLFCELKDAILELIDVKSSIADVVESNSKDATKLPRDCSPPRVGNASHLTSDMKQVIDLISDLKSEQSTLNSNKRKGKSQSPPPPKRQKAATKTMNCADGVAPNTASVDTVPLETASAEVACVDDGSTQLHSNMVAPTNECRMGPVIQPTTSHHSQRKPRSSISKTLCYTLFDHVVMLLIEGEKLKIWSAELSEDVDDFVAEFFSNHEAFPKLN